MIPRGTTPTLRWVFRKIPVELVTEAFLTIQQEKENIIEKTFSEAEASEDALQWTLTQEDTLKIEADKQLSLQLRFKTSAGYVGASPIYPVMGYQVLKDGVI